jgi:hypothetical protein
VLLRLDQKQIQRYILALFVNLSIVAKIFYYCWNLILCYAVDDKNKQHATFWSCLQDIQEGLQVDFYYHQCISFFRLYS